MTSSNTGMTSISADELRVHTKRELREMAKSIGVTGITNSNKEVIIAKYLVCHSARALTIEHDVSSHIGRRKDMEDTHLIGSWAGGIQVFGVFDGHGGKKMANLCVGSLVHEFQASFRGVVLTDEKAVSMAIENAFLRFDDLFMIHSDGSGSTATMVFKIGAKAYFVNLGDSRTILFDKRRELLLTTKDHKPNDPDERRRISAAGGYVSQGAVPRVCDSLAVSRAFGDYYLKRNGSKYMGRDSIVSPIPDVTVRQLNDGDVIILASDGFWDGVRNEVAASWDVTHARSLVEASMRVPGYNGDNVTVMVLKISATE